MSVHGFPAAAELADSAKSDLTPFRVLHYAVGGGLGHLVRARAFLDALLPGTHATVLSASEHAADPRVLGPIAHERVPRELESDRDAFRAWLAQRIDAIAPELIVVDAFPCGILGELADFAPLARVPAWHLARLLRWDAYAPLVGAAPPRFARCFRLEALDSAHEAFLRGCSSAIEDLDLHRDEALDTNEQTPYWLVVHSGPEAEVAELIAHAFERRSIERADATPILVASPYAPRDLPPNCRAIDTHPAHALFARAARIVSAAGFNVMRQAAPYRDKHIVVPFARRFDDQYARARRASAKARDPQAR